MEIQSTIPVLRIFDYEKALGFYRDWLGFVVDWEHELEPGSPRYLQVSMAGMVLHLSEHHGDSCPGARIFLWCTGLKDYHQVLLEKDYKYGRPGIEQTFYKAWSVEVLDPFGNRITFNEKVLDIESA